MTLVGTRAFPRECCFQVIYIVANIFILPACIHRQTARVENIRSTDARDHLAAGGLVTPGNWTLERAFEEERSD
jgi:hypothetical protein